MLNESSFDAYFGDLKSGNLKTHHTMPIQRKLMHDTYLDETYQNIERKVRKICKKPPNDSAVISTHSWRNGESKVNEMFARIRKKTANLESKFDIHEIFQSPNADMSNKNNPQNSVLESKTEWLLNNKTGSETHKMSEQDQKAIVTNEKNPFSLLPKSPSLKRSPTSKPLNVHARLATEPKETLKPSKTPIESKSTRSRISPVLNARKDKSTTNNTDQKKRVSHEQKKPQAGKTMHYILRKQKPIGTLAKMPVNPQMDVEPVDQTTLPNETNHKSDENKTETKARVVELDEPANNMANEMLLDTTATRRLDKNSHLQKICAMAFKLQSQIQQTKYDLLSQFTMKNSQMITRNSDEPKHRNADSPKLVEINLNVLSESAAHRKPVEQTKTNPINEQHAFDATTTERLKTEKKIKRKLLLVNEKPVNNASSSEDPLNFISTFMKRLKKEPVQFRPSEPFNRHQTVTVQQEPTGDLCGTSIEDVIKQHAPNKTNDDRLDLDESTSRTASVHRRKRDLFEAAKSDEKTVQHIDYSRKYIDADMIAENKVNDNDTEILKSIIMESGDLILDESQRSEYSIDDQDEDESSTINNSMNAYQAEVLTSNDISFNDDIDQRSQYEQSDENDIGRQLPHLQTAGNIRPMPWPMANGEANNKPRYTPYALDHMLRAGINYLETLSSSEVQLQELDKLRSLGMVQEENISLAGLLKSQQYQYDASILKHTVLKDTKNDPSPMHKSTVRQTTMRDVSTHMTQSVISDSSRTSTAIIQRPVQTATTRTKQTGLDASQQSESAYQSSRQAQYTDKNSSNVTNIRTASNLSVHDDTHVIEDAADISEDFEQLETSSSSSTSSTTSSTDSSTETTIRTEKVDDKHTESIKTTENLSRTELSTSDSSISEDVVNQDSQTAHVESKRSKAESEESITKSFKDVIMKQFIEDEKLRYKHQAYLLKLKEKALMDTIKEEMSLMRNKKNYDVSKALNKIQKTMAKLNREQEDISEFRRIQASTMKKKTKLFENYRNSLKQCQSRLQKYSPKADDKDGPSSIDNDDDYDDDNSLSYADFASDRFRDNSKRSKPASGALTKPKPNRRKEFDSKKTTEEVDTDVSDSIGSTTLESFRDFKDSFIDDQNSTDPPRNVNNKARDETNSNAACLNLGKIEKIKQKIDFYEQLIGRIKVGINNATLQALRIDNESKPTSLQQNPVIEKNVVITMAPTTDNRRLNANGPAIKAHDIDMHESRTSEIQDDLPSTNVAYSSFADEKQQKTETRDYSDTFVANDESIKTAIDDDPNKTDNSSSFDPNSANPIKKFHVADDEQQTRQPTAGIQSDNSSSGDDASSDIATESIDTNLNVESNPSRLMTVEKSLGNKKKSDIDDKTTYSYDDEDDKSLTDTKNNEEEILPVTKNTDDHDSTPRQVNLVADDEIFDESPSVAYSQSDKSEANEQIRKQQHKQQTPSQHELVAGKEGFILDLVLTEALDLYEKIRLGKIEKTLRSKSSPLENFNDNLSVVNQINFDEGVPLPGSGILPVVVPAIDLKSLDNASSTGNRSQYNVKDRKSPQSMYSIAESQGFVVKIIARKLEQVASSTDSKQHSRFDMDDDLLTKGIKPSFKQLLVELVDETAMGLYARTGGFNRIVNDFTRLHETENCIKKQLSAMFEKKSGSMLAMTLSNSSSSSSSKWRLQRRLDMIDRMLDKEMRDNEFEWANFEKEETEAKLLMADLITDTIVNDAILNLFSLHKAKNSNVLDV